MGNAINIYLFNNEILIHYYNIIFTHFQLVFYLNIGNIFIPTYMFYDFDLE